MMRKVLLPYGWVVLGVSACVVESVDVRDFERDTFAVGSNGQIALNHDKVPTLPECAPGHYVRKNADGWECGPILGSGNDETSQEVQEPVDHDTLGALACTDGQIPQYSAQETWACADVPTFGDRPVKLLRFSAGNRTGVRDLVQSPGLTGENCFHMINQRSGCVVNNESFPNIQRPVVYIYLDPIPDRITITRWGLHVGYSTDPAVEWTCDLVRAEVVQDTISWVASGRGHWSVRQEKNTQISVNMDDPRVVEWGWWIRCEPDANYECEDFGCTRMDFHSAFFYYEENGL